MFEIGDEVEIILPNWAETRHGIVAKVTASNVHVTMHYPNAHLEYFTYRFLKPSDIKLIHRPSSPVPLDDAEYNEIMQAQELINGE